MVKNLIVFIISLTLEFQDIHEQITATGLATLYNFCLLYNLSHHQNRVDKSQPKHGCIGLVGKGIY
jgi:phosphopantetheinyl transferase